MKMDPPPGGERQAGKKVVEDKTFPPPGPPPDVQPLRRTSRGQQLLAQSIQASDQRQLIVIERQTRRAACSAITRVKRNSVAISG